VQTQRVVEKSCAEFAQTRLCNAKTCARMRAFAMRDASAPHRNARGFGRAERRVDAQHVDCIESLEAASLLARSDE